MANNSTKKKKQYVSELDAIQNGYYSKVNNDIDIGQLKEYDKQNPTYQAPKKDGFFDNWFKAGAFSDGFDWTDVPKTILGSAADVGLGVVEGIMSGGEGIGDWLSYRTADVLDFFGGDEAARNVRKNANINATDELFNVVKKKGKVEENSVFGTKADSISNAMGTVLTMTATAGLGGAAGLGKVGQTALSMGTMGIGSAGSGESEALQSGATLDEARLYGAISGAGEVFSEMLFGGLGKGAKAIGISKGLSSADDMLAKAVSDKFKSRLAKNLSQFAIKSGAEGVEEVISGIIQAAGKKLTYMSEEDLGELLKNEDLLDQFIVGAISSGISQAPGLVKTTAKGQDFLTGYTKNEQKVYDTVLNERIEEAQKESKKPLTRKQINTIEEEVKNDFENGYIGTKKIEDTLGIGEIYNNLKNDTELAFGRDLSQDELRDIENETKEKYADLIKEDNIIRRNYYEDSLRTQKFTADINQYDEKLRDTVQRAIDSGILNNSTKTHQFIDFIAKISADKGVKIDFTNNESLKNSSLGIKGATINGYVNANGDITLNINSNKSLNSIVGHEITHVLEGSELYQALSDSIQEYAQTKGEYEKRLGELKELYKDVEGADVTKELTADLVGDYLFTNQDFINHLTQNRNLFQKIYDEIKYLVKQATAGSKEARQLNKVMKMFEQAYRDNSVKLAEQENAVNNRFALAYVDKARLSKNEIARLNEAIDLKNKGYTDEQIWQQTQVIMGDTIAASKVDIPDLKFKDREIVKKLLKMNTDVRLADVMEGDMFKNYPQFKNYEIRVFDFEKEAIKEKLSPKEVKQYKGTKGAVTTDGKIVINNTVKTLDEVEGIISHEVQHLIQEASGKEGNTAEILAKEGIKAYKLNPNELEAETTRVMRELTQRQRKLINPQSVEEEIKKYYEENNYGQLNVDTVINRLLNKHGLQFSLSTDSNGKELSQQQQEYFKDSKVRDDEGRLQPVYHMTNADFNKINFDKNYQGVFWFASSKQDLQDGTVSAVGTRDKANSKIMELYANITNPAGWREYDNYGIGQLKEMGYDGVILKEDDGSFVGFVFNDSNQIKNIDNTNPTEDADIRYSLSQNEELNNYIENNDFNLDNSGNLKVNNLTDKQIKKLTKAYNKNGYNDVNENFVRNRIEEGFKIPRAVADTFIKDDLGYKPQIDTTQVFEDAEGNPLTKEQVEFYKDSDVRDIRGRLIPVYHTTDAEFTVFNPKAQTKNGKKYGKGLYFSTTPENFGNNEMKLYLNAKDGEYKFVQDKGYYIVQEPNMVKNVDNKTPTYNPDIRYSLTQDNTGRELTEQQQEYFKDSKVRDNNGNLEVMYHTTPSKFTVFDNSKLGENTEYDNTAFGFFVTPNSEFSSRFGDINNEGNESNTMELYANVTNPITHPYNADYKYSGDELDNIVERYFEAIGEEEGLNELKSYVDDGDYENLYDAYMNVVVTELSSPFENADYEKELLEENGYDAVEFVEGNESNVIDGGQGNEPVISYAVFNSNQLKNIDNKNPTDNQDIRYSLSSSLQDNNINTTTDINNDFFKEHETDFDKNNGKSHILYDNYGNKIEQTTNVYKLEKGNNLAKLSTTLEQNVDDNYGKLYIEELYVKNKGEGLGTDIINSLKQYAKENNLDLYTMKELSNPKTQKFWNSVTEQEFGLDRTSRQLYSYYQPGYNISKTDSTGKKLSYEQRQYFKDSKVVDENRNLMPVYHASRGNQFTVFDKNKGYNIDAFYFTKDSNVASHWSTKGEFVVSDESYNNIKNQINNAKNYQELIDIVNDNNFGYKLSIENGRIEQVYDGGAETSSPMVSFDKLKQDVEYNLMSQKYSGDIYKEYLNITNPLVVDAKKQPYHSVEFEGKKLNTETIASIAKERGYDGVIVKNVYETDYENRLTDDYIAFEPNQIKNVDNTNPTSSPDIRYSLTQKVDTELDDLTNEQYEYFKNTKAVDKFGELEVVYHGTPHEFSVFDIEKAGETGLMFGNGFYFTTSQGRAEAFIGDNDNGLKSGYVNIEKPASRDTKTMTYNDFYNLYNALNENPNMYDDEMGMSNIDALLSDFGDIYDDKENTIKKFYDSYDDDVSLIDNLSYIGNPAEMYKTLRDVTGYDGIIVEKPSDFSSERWFVAFNPDQFKLKSNKTPTDNVDMNLSLSKIDDVAPVRKPGLTYGEDIALAPVQEQVSALQEDIAAIREDYRQQSEDIKNELKQLRAEREEMSRGIYENAPSINDIAPTQESSYYENTFAPELSDDLLKRYKSYFKSEFGLKGKQLNEAMEGIKELSTNPNLTASDVYNYLKENYGKEEIRNYNYDIQEVKSELRNTAIGVDEQTKKDIASMYDTYGKFRKAYLGKLKLVEYDGKNGIDSIYKDLSNKYPQLFNEDTISNTADQLMQLAEVTKMDNYTSMFEDLPEEIVRNDAAELYSMIRDYRNETAQRLAEEQVPDSYYDNIVPTEEIPYEEQLENRINELQNDLDLIPRKEYYAIQDRTIEDEIREVPEKKDITGLLNDQYQRKADRVEKSKPVIAKEKTDLRRGIDTLKTLFTNRNAEIDNLSRETGNKNIKFAGDMLNNYSAEAQNDIQIAQTDNYGKAIGKSIQEIFEPAKEGGLEQAFNDYLINYSNIDRWEAGKGSATPLDISQRLVANYEAKYPQFKRWAIDVWKYGENARNNMLESGLINQDTYNMLEERYPHYVPYISDSNNFDATIDKMTELKARPIKRARGGATELYPIEEALNRYTFAQKRALRTNNLYKEIVNELLKVKNESPIGADLRTDYTDLKENLYRDDTGNYLTAYDEGVRKSVQISDDLFKALSNDLENRIRDIEQRLSIITKPLQAASNIRRKILTSWSPSFPVKNALKDMQDASLNSTDTTKFMKNYPGAFKELVENKNDLVKQFKALYGAGNTMGVFENESGLYDAKKGLKNSKFLKGISNLNEIIELAPRYAEFKTSLENGASIQEAMYNAREITTNFSRGGVITKALNRNGFTFLNASVQGLSKFIRNFSGENGARGIANSLIKAAVLGIAPALFNELAFGIGDDKDEEYEALPDYIKDNYYIIKTGDGNYVRIPKGRMLSVFGSAARRTIELAEGEENAFEGYLKNANNQIGINDPEENNIFAPFIQAFGSENGTAWYGGDIVPSRLQDKPADEQYDASTDKMSIWLGQKLGISPYKLHYVIDQYSGGIGDIVLPMITDEATSEGGLLAPIKDQFTADSTTDNKYVSDFYSKSDELKVKANSSKATDEDIVRSQYMYGISSEMAKLYAERRNVQANNSLTKAEKYEKSQAIKREINRLAKYGLDSNENISATGNYAQAGEDMGYYKNAKGKWTPIDQKDIIATESIGLTDREKSTYYGVKNDMYNIDQKYEPKLKTASDEEKTVLNAQKKVDIINAIKETNLPDEAKAVLYDKKYASTETLDALLNIGIDFDSYLDLEAQNFTADKNIYGKTINGSKKSKVYNYINNLNMDYDKKIMLAKLYYKSDNTYNREIINSLNSNPGISYDEMKQILKAMGMKIDDYGQITW